MDLHLAAPRHAAGIADLSRSEIEHGLSWSWTPARVRRAIADSDTNVLVATEGPALLGFGIMVYRGETAHLSLLAVRPSSRRRGVGTALLVWLERVAQVAGVRSIGLEARHGNARALAFYRRHGYRRAAIVTGMYQGIDDGVRLEKRLSLRA